ncbi:MAG: HTH-type transcriptional regulator GltR [Xylophilus sp.]|nr:MAG: HTH-type transcriptional regulator GltR [Xylophilus sp.]
MKALEDVLGTPLFVREARGVKLTPAAHAALPRARRMVAEYEDMVEARQDARLIAGSMVVGSITSAAAVLAESVLALKAVYPALNITVVHGRKSELRNKVIAREMDAAIFVETAGRLGDELDWQHLYAEPLMLVCSSVHGPHISAKDLLKTQPYIRFDHSGATAPMVDQMLKKAQVQPQTVLEMNSVTSIVELVRKDVGVSIVPILRSFAWDEDTALRLVPMPGRVFERRIGILRDVRRAHVNDALLQEMRRRLA